MWWFYQRLRWGRGPGPAGGAFGVPVLESPLAGREWLEGVFSLADVAYAPHLWLIVEGGFDLAHYPRVGAWLERLLARPAWRKAADLVFGS